MNILNDKTLIGLASIITIISSAFAVQKYLEARTSDAKASVKSEVEPGGALFASAGLVSAVLPSALATDPGFSNYARRWDIWQGPQLASGTLQYGQVIPT